MTGQSWRCFAASATGSAHADAGAGCSDAHVIAPYASTGAALVVADGLGSSAEAALAARLAVSIGARVLRSAGPTAGLEDSRDHVRKAIAAARTALRNLADAIGVPRADMGTTLLVCVAGEHGVAFGGVGDGFLGVRARDERGVVRHHLLTIEPPSLIANETSTLANALEVEVLAIDDPLIDGLALATDGFEPAAIIRPTSSDRALRAGVIDALLAHADAASHSGSLYIDVVTDRWDDASADDRTIALAVRS